MPLRNKEVKELNREIEQKYNLISFFDKKDNVDSKKVGDTLVIIKEKALFFYNKNQKENNNVLVPTLHLLLTNPNMFPKIIIDMPAIPFVMKGADIMRPGIKGFDESKSFVKGDFVVIVDENNKKPLAVGEALFSSQEMKDMEKGKVIKNIHRVGDEIWNTK